MTNMDDSESDSCIRGDALDTGLLGIKSEEDLNLLLLNYDEEEQPKTLTAGGKE